jgi:hypothetical protein
MHKQYRDCGTILELVDKARQSNGFSMRAEEEVNVCRSIYEEYELQIAAKRSINNLKGLMQPFSSTIEALEWVMNRFNDVARSLSVDLGIVSRRLIACGNFILRVNNARANKDSVQVEMLLEDQPSLVQKDQSTQAYLKEVLERHREDTLNERLNDALELGCTQDELKELNRQALRLKHISPDTERLLNSVEALTQVRNTSDKQALLSLGRKFSSSISFRVLPVVDEEMALVMCEIETREYLGALIASLSELQTSGVKLIGSDDQYSVKKNRILGLEANMKRLRSSLVRLDSLTYDDDDYDYDDEDEDEEDQGNERLSVLHENSSSSSSHPHPSPHGGLLLHGRSEDEESKTHISRRSSISSISRLSARPSIGLLQIRGSYFPEYHRSNNRHRSVTPSDATGMASMMNSRRNVSFNENTSSRSQWVLRQSAVALNLLAIPSILFVAELIITSCIESTPSWFMLPFPIARLLKASDMERVQSYGFSPAYLGQMVYEMGVEAALRELAVGSDFAPITPLRSDTIQSLSVSEALGLIESEVKLQPQQEALLVAVSNQDDRTLVRLVDERRRKHEMRLMHRVGLYRAGKLDYSPFGRPINCSTLDIRDVIIGTLGKDGNYLLDILDRAIDQVMIHRAFDEDIVSTIAEKRVQLFKTIQDYSVRKARK